MDFFGEVWESLRESQLVLDQRIGLCLEQYVSIGRILLQTFGQTHPKFFLEIELRLNLLSLHILLFAVLLQTLKQLLRGNPFFDGRTNIVNKCEVFSDLPIPLLSLLNNGLRTNPAMTVGIMTIGVEVLILFIYEGECTYPIYRVLAFRFESLVQCVLLYFAFVDRGLELFWTHLVVLRILLKVGV